MGIADDFQRAIALHRANRLPDAEMIYRQILAQQPNHAKALEMLGIVAQQCGQAQAAVDLIARAASLNPRDPGVWINLGEAYRALARNDRAVEMYTRAIALTPLPQAFYNLGLALTDLGREAEAIAAYQAALRLDPRHAKSHNNLGMLLREERLPEAIKELREATSLAGDDADCWTNLGNLLTKAGELDQAQDAGRRAVQLSPQVADYHHNLAVTFQQQGLIEQSVASFRTAIQLNPRSAAIHSNLLYTLLFSPEFSPAELLREHRAWNEQHAVPLAGAFAHDNDCNEDRALRVGYVSPDFKFHPLGRCLLPILEHHASDNVHATLYADVRKPDPLSRRMQQVAQWVDTTRMSDAELAQRVHADRIDILVDLTLHSSRNRLLVFARKPAPVQVTYLAYPGTSGMDAIDYRLSDDRLDPPGCEALYSEQTIRLPGSYWCYNPPPVGFPIADPPAALEKKITFGSLNHFLKISEQALATWRQLMGETPSSRLLLHCESPSQRARITGMFAEGGIDAARLEFVGLLPFDAYLRTCQRIDIALDAHPYTGGVTTCDMLWMGVPVVSLAGDCALHRGGVSVLSAAGLEELVAQTPEQYIQLAVGLATNIDRLRELRHTMRDRLLNSPLLDAKRAAKDIEAAYRQMWISWCRR